uniref:ALS2 C-terminal like n=1 Tax=Varanus komodoensis TaxID=61221 RepID=A0A8D2Q640_VARKO
WPCSELYQMSARLWEVDDWLSAWEFKAGKSQECCNKGDKSRCCDVVLQDELCIPERRLLEDSHNVAVSTSIGKSDRVLLFNDILVLIQVGRLDRPRYPWLDQHTLRVGTPEEEFFLLARDPQAWAIWQWKLKRAVCQAMDGRRDFPLWGRAGEGREPPLCRFSTFTFRSEGRLKDAAYEGEWRLGKPHGKGTLMWPDGRNYVGDFEEGLEHGFGICLVPCASEDRYDCYKCHWREGRRSGYGICEYGNEVVYKGYFKEDLRHGFGILDSTSSKEHPSRYTGHWENDRKSGYGVWDDKERGERYIGMWHEDQRHGAGIVVMQSGVCYQRTFHMDKMVRSGILLLEDDSVYEGNFTRDLTFVGKGKLTANKFTLEGTFSHRSTGLCTLPFLARPKEPLASLSRQLGQVAFPVEQRWEGLLSPFLEFIRSGAQGEMEEFFMGFHVQTSRELRKSQEYLFCHRGPEEAARKVDILEELREPREQEVLRCYLEQALKSSLHPLGKLLTALTLAFQATYSGIGANKHLLSMAQEEVKHYAEKIWEFYQCLLNLAWEVKGQTPPEALKESDLSGPGLILPLILPYFYPELLMLYMLHHEKEDELYCQGIVNLSLFPDVKLLEFLDVQRHFWPLKDVTLSNSRVSCFPVLSCSWFIPLCNRIGRTTVDPREKLDILQQTFEEVERTIHRVLGKEHSLSMDELLPLLVYVVIRAR